ncbi:LysR family transcriptional regulator [Pseudomonas nitroreducens]|nr:LysR family transcriptional regulator [Pseudomonas nitroreducens]MCJ1882606.1 LysR family transcriptional regulator [Pseudomonas nitroreducens]MCJ1895352.1 LysR family transcriptional regulator [Pseudomonas nitroreducens]NMZ57323.1 LysR family transcriptional regulator [Pseudomonas nitroreducens]SNR97374.1 transcriptional regulator, LysR family [Pseudomonas nitroreducens]
MEWDDLRFFLAIARARSLGAAAKHLGVSHPTVGRRLQALEQACGQAFFRRTSEGLVPTAMGEGILSLAEDMESSALAIARRIDGSEQPEGILRISSADWFAGYVLAPVLGELVRRHPAVVPEVIAGQRLSDLTRREADIAFRIVPFDQPDIVQRRLMSMPYGLYASAAVPFEPGPDGADCKLIVMNTAQAYYPDVLWVQRMLPAAPTVFTSSSRTVQAQMCARGLGVAVLPRPLGDQLPALTRIELSEEPPPRDIWMGYHQDMRRLDRLRALAELASEMLGSH